MTRTGFVSLAAAAAIALASGGTDAAAHVTMAPAQSKLGKLETYTLTVPTEGQTATTAIVLDVPDGVNLLTVKSPIGSYSIKRDNGRILSVRWPVQMPPGGETRLMFVARNPIKPVRGVRWHVHQFFADGSHADWIDPPPAHPAPATLLMTE